MSRTHREISPTGYYHIVIKGAGKMILFECSDDYAFFLSILKKYAVESDVGVLAYCLMSNHVHLLIEDSDGAMPTFMKRVGTAYAMRFNERTGHEGPVFQGRYWSRAIMTDEQLLEAARYIHQNPAASAVCATEAYQWSSYQAYLGDPSFVSTDVILDMLGGEGGFFEFMGKPNTSYDATVFRPAKLSDEQALAIVRDALGDEGEGWLTSGNRRLRNRALLRIRDAGIGPSQAARITGIGVSTISRIFSRDPNEKNAKRGPSPICIISG